MITRFGHGKVADHLPGAIAAVKKAGLPVLWSSDPMHGNTIKADGGMKTRNFDHILSELRQCFQIHQSEGSHLGGVHFELTGENVTECVGGSEGIAETDLNTAYETFCDPRLNYSQSLELAFNISEILQRGS